MISAHYDKVSLLLPMSGSNNGTTFADYSSVTKVVTRVGDTKTVTSQSKYYGSSAYFDGSGDHLSVPFSAGVDLRTGDFTIAAWMRFDDFAASRVLASAWDSTRQQWLAGASATTIWFNFRQTNNTTYNSTCTWTHSLSPNEWVHIAFQRAGDVYDAFVNGVSLGAIVNSTAINTGDRPLLVGAHTAAGALAHKGHMQDFCIVKGAAIYAGDFTPPARLIGEISGAVHDDTDVGAVRRIVAFPRLAPARVATTQSAAGGSYTLTGLPVTEHTVVYLDDDAGTLYNDLCHRVIPA